MSKIYAVDMDYCTTLLSRAIVAYFITLHKVIQKPRRPFSLTEQVGKTEM